MSSPIVLVTGCSRGGIGFALCEEFASKNCKVYATARNLSKLEGLPEMNVEKLELDVTNDTAVQDVVKTILEKEGRIDILVNNAGMIAAGALIDQTPQQVLEAFDANTFSVLRLARAVIPSMAKRKSGLVVNISSITEELPSPWNGLYCATKASVRSISEVLAMECRPFNIQVVNVAPGSVTSNISQNQMSKFTVPEGSLFSAYLPGMIRRINASQGPKSMETREFARRVVKQVLSKSPPLHLIEGGNKWLLKIMVWLPRKWILWWMWNMFNKTE
ncbi:oxidoreductase [Marasmius fiardii PR-910]|nr:oxidoreductase [Marasmius fiardii PR-910]